jgi:hypothetical protein
LLSVLAMVMIVGIVAFLYFFPPTTDHEHDKSTTAYEDWFQIRWSGYLQSLGTFVFTFVSVRSSSAVCALDGVLQLSHQPALSSSNTWCTWRTRRSSPS